MTSDEARTRARERRILNRYGLTPEDYQRLYGFQSGLCAVCDRPLEDKKIVVDHDHKEHRVRGLLCRYCNKFVVGRHRRGLDGVRLLANAAQYLANPTAERVGIVKLMPERKRRRAA